MLSFTLLGQLILSKNGVTLSKFRSKKEIALLIYLAQTEQTHRRDFIADLLWDARSTKQALSNLRTVLARLRKQVDDALLITRETVTLTPVNQQEVDSAKLLQTLAAVGEINSAQKAATLQKALDAYRGEFLANFNLSNAPRFNAWVAQTREHIHDQVIAAYHKLVQFACATGDIEYGIAATRRWLQVDELDETAHTLLIQLLLEADNENEAIAHYENCVSLLRTKLDVGPPAKMVALINGIRLKSPAAPRLTATIQHNLPAAHDQFFGRKAAQQEIHTRLDQPWCRVVTITGQGGVGKTRLATTIARSRLNQYRDGVWLVDLAKLDPDDDDLVEAIAVEIAITLDMRLTGTEKPVKQLLDHLQHKQMMLALDNFEHLLAGTPIVLDIVRRCEQIQMLITSREALRIRAEWTIALTGLSYPINDSDERPSDAVELFVARRAQQRRGTILADEMAAIRTICRMVGGLPLAIELAAALTRHTISQAIADRLRDGFDVLAATLQDIPQRHRGLHVVFEMSWTTLTLALQIRLSRLAVFRGGFAEEAAYPIAEADAQSLAALCEKSLLSYGADSNRYMLHPVIRAYAAEKRDPADPTPQKHAHYYLTLLAQHTESLQKNEPQKSMRLLAPDIDNVRRGWSTAVSHHKTDLLSDALTSLSIYYQLRGLAHEGEAVMYSTLRAAKGWGPDGAALAARVGLELARFQIRLSHYQPAMQTIKKALKLAAQCQDHWAEGMGHVLWGEALWRLGKYDAAENKLAKALSIAHAIDATLIIGWCRHHLGIINDIQSRYDAAHEHLEKACAAWRSIDNAQVLSNSLNSIGLVCYHQGDLAAAQEAMKQALTLCNQLDNRHLQSLLLNNLSIISTEQGDYMGAQFYLQLGLELATASSNLIAQGDIFINLGRNYRLQGEMDLALENLECGIRISDSTGNRASMAIAMINLADVKREQGDFEQAQVLYSRALKTARESGLQRFECEVLIGMAELLGQINASEAREYSAEAIVLAKAIHNPGLLDRANAIDSDLNALSNTNK